MFDTLGHAAYINCALPSARLLACAMSTSARATCSVEHQFDLRVMQHMTSRLVESGPTTSMFARLLEAGLLLPQSNAQAGLGVST